MTTTQQQEQLLNDWLHGADHDFAKVQEIIASRQASANRGEERTVPVQQQQQQLDPFTAKWNEWFVASFDNRMVGHIKEMEMLNRAIDKLVTGIKKRFDHMEANIHVISDVLGARPDRRCTPSFVAE